MNKGKMFLKLMGFLLFAFLVYSLFFSVNPLITGCGGGGGSSSSGGSRTEGVYTIDKPKPENYGKYHI